MNTLKKLLEKRLDHSFEQKARELAVHASLNYFDTKDYKLGYIGHKDFGKGFYFDFQDSSGETIRVDVRKL